MPLRDVVGLLIIRRSKNSRVVMSWRAKKNFGENRPANDAAVHHGVSWRESFRAFHRARV